MDAELKMKLALGKIPVVQLNDPNDFQRWHLALRKIVSAFSMGDALLYSIPKSELGKYLADEAKARLVAGPSPSSSSTISPSSTPQTSTSTASATATTTTPAAKKKEKGKGKTSDGKDVDKPADSPRVSISDVDAADAEAKAHIAEMAAATARQSVDTDLMRLLGVTREQDEFFSSSTIFYNTRLHCDEKETDAFFRTEIWNWMEASLTKGQYRSIAKNITPVYDIRKLYNRAVEVANTATAISCIREYKKIFTMTMKEDIFQYHEELLQQIRVVRGQLEKVRLKLTIPEELVQNLLLDAAWQDPRYREIADEISRKQRDFTLDELLRDLQRQSMLVRHLNGGNDPHPRMEASVRIKAAKETASKPCFLFQKGSCTRDRCPFAHDKREGEAAKAKKPETAKPTDASKPTIETKKNKLTCTFCKKKGHDESICRSKMGRAKVAVSGEPDGFLSEEAPLRAAVLVAEDAPVEAKAAMARGSGATRWCVDSGANRDICNERHLFANGVTPKAIRIGEAGQGHSFTSDGEGAIPLHVQGKAIPLFERTIYAEKVGENIISVAEAVDRGLTVVFTKDAVEFHKATTVRVPVNPILKGGRDRRNRLYYVDLPSPPAAQGSQRYSHTRGEDAKASSTVSTLLSRTYSEYENDYDLWHARMGHVNPRLLALAVPGVASAREKHNCDVCTRGKLHKFPHSGVRPTQAEMPWLPGEYISCDLFGPLAKSNGGARYAAFYVDHRSKFVYVKPLVSKDEQYVAFEEVVNDLAARSGRALRFFKSDGDGIFTGAKALALYDKFKIRHTSRAPPATRRATTWPSAPSARLRN